MRPWCGREPRSWQPTKPYSAASMPRSGPGFCAPFNALWTAEGTAPAMRRTRSALGPAGEGASRISLRLFKTQGNPVQAGGGMGVTSEAFVGVQGRPPRGAAGTQSRIADHLVLRDHRCVSGGQAAGSYRPLSGISETIDMVSALRLGTCMPIKWMATR